MNVYERWQIVCLFTVFYLFNLGTLFVRADIQCYQCTSTFLNMNGKPVAGKENGNCPADDSVNPATTYAGSCRSKCLIKSRTDGVVIRSCSAQRPLPQPLPEHGCFAHQKEILCLCNTTFCNGQAMNDLLQNRTIKDLKSLARAASELYEKNNKEHPEKNNGPPQCYVCQSSFSGNINENCPGNDHINSGPTIYRMNCSGVCYTKTDIRFKGIVFRGCSDVQWAFPKPTPKDGCYKYYMDVWCICRDSLCNTKPLGKPKTDKELDYLVVKPKSKNKSSRHMTTASLVLMAAGAAVLSTESTGAGKQ